MCGISGFIDKSKKLEESNLKQFNQAIKHRGPDSEGLLFFDKDNVNIGLGHVRLSILDLSPLGSQPMHFEHLHIALNGEIYNFKEIRELLQDKGYQFSSESDTEVVIKAFHAWGTSCVEKFIGMFAFAIYDDQQQKLFLCRDRAGVKPLYYYLSEDQFIFGSELKVFFSLSDFDAKVDPVYLKEFLKYGYVTNNNTLVTGVKKLEPGTWIELEVSSLKMHVRKYWELTSFYKEDKYSKSFNEAVEESHDLIQSACNYRMVADVPVGIFLSGGFDSSMVTAILQKDRTQKLKTFTIGFPDGVDESPDAERIAKHLGTEHTTFHCTYKEAKDFIPDLPFFYDEPNGDISCIPTMLVSQIAKKEVTVALSADGGDELFAGYSGYKTNVEIINQFDKIPLKSLVGWTAKNTGRFFENSKPHIAKRLEGLSQVLGHNDNRKYNALTHVFNGAPQRLIDRLVPAGGNEIFSPRHFPGLKVDQDALFILDFEHSLRDLLLTKVDRATMAFSLEGREPLLDHRLIEFAAKLPYHYKHDGNVSKRIIKEIVYQYIPKEIMNRPKIGFDLPIFDWLKNDLRYLVDEYLSDKAIEASGCLDKKVVSEIVDAFHSNRLRYKSLFWNIIVFQMWYFRWIKKQ